MKSEDTDDELLRLYRASAKERPDAELDRQILQTARLLRARRRQVSLIFAVAASLLIVLYATMPGRQSLPAAPRPNTATFGLYEGRAAEILSDPDAMRQMAIKQMPGGAN